MKAFRLIYFIGISGSALVYYIFGVCHYFRSLRSSSPDYTTSSKYKRLVWKAHRVQTALNPYYVALSSVGKKKFISRLIHVLAHKKFVARQGATITIEKKIVICGTLVQLTFGLNKYLLPKFKSIILYPREFEVKMLQAKGMTWGMGTIMFSWIDTYKGYHDPHDNINLALHEWAQAFRLDHRDDPAWLKYRDINKNNEEVNNLWITGIAKNDSKLLRPYGYTNQEEYFAVATEHFFESPNEM